MKNLSRFLFALAGVCFLLTAFLVWQRQVERRLAFEIDQLTAPGEAGAGNTWPVALVIKELNIELPVFPTVLEDGRWETTSEGVSYLVGSAIPGEIGNSILYGHNWPNLLGRLLQADQGQEIVIVSSAGEVKRFVIIETAVVTPNQTHVLGQTKDIRLTVYTCTGFLDRKRFVVMAAPAY